MTNESKRRREHREAKKEEIGMQEAARSATKEEQMGSMRDAELGQYYLDITEPEDHTLGGLFPAFESKDIKMGNLDQKDDVRIHGLGRMSEWAARAIKPAGTEDVRDEVDAINHLVGITGATSRGRHGFERRQQNTTVKEARMDSKERSRGGLLGKLFG